MVTEPTPFHRVQSLAVVSAMLLAAMAGRAMAGRAMAEPTEAEKRTEAEAIFAQAKDLMTAKACPKLEEVVKLQPMGIGAASAPSGRSITMAPRYPHLSPDVGS